MALYYPQRNEDDTQPIVSVSADVHAQEAPNEERESTHSDAPAIS